MLGVYMHGMEVRPVSIDVEPSRTFEVLGLPEAAAKEARIRVRAALQQAGYDGVHRFRLDPSVPAGPYDLAMAAAIFEAYGATMESGALMLAELNMSGQLRPVRGVLPILRWAASQGITRAVVAPGNESEAARVAGIQAFVAQDLTEVRAFMKGQPLPRAEAIDPLPPRLPSMEDLAIVQVDLAKLNAAVDSGFVLLSGPPGGGKTMVGRRIASLLPPMSADQRLEASSIHSVAGILPVSGILTDRPFRSPHHTVSEAGLIGGGNPARPGEVSLAHHGVLFLDEINEFRTSSLNALMATLRDGESTTIRTGEWTRFPAKPAVVVAATNNCPCGQLRTDEDWEVGSRCKCMPAQIEAFWRRIPEVFREHQVQVTRKWKP